MPDLFDDFGQLVLDATKPAPDYLEGPHQRPVGNRFNVYRNNVVLGLSNALAESFPVIRKLLGDENFYSLAKIYVCAHPPKTPLMMYFGADFSQFLKLFSPLAHLPYLADVALLEQYRRESYHSADATPINPAALADIPESNLPNIRLRLQPSMRTIVSPYPILSIWRYNMTDDQSPLPATGEQVLLARPFAEVEMRQLPEGAVQFLIGLNSRSTLEKSIALGTRAAPNFDVAAQISGLLAANLIVEIY